MHQPHRLWATSDIHIDNQENYQLLLDLSDQAYRNDMLIIAGDVTDNLQKLLDLLTAMQEKFLTVAFVPGNHELWLTDKTHQHSIEKFEAILAACDELEIVTRPVRFGQTDQSIWVVPLFSWYEQAPDKPASLFAPKHGVIDKTDELWRDFFLTKWPDSLELSIAEYFLELNSENLALSYDDPVVSFSHFLPRQELIYSNTTERRQNPLNRDDPYPEFNFSRVAGNWDLDKQIRDIGSRLHIYGHQHRNRTREIEGVTYISHCMGYPIERKSRHIARDAEHPRLIWQPDTGFTC